MLGNKVLLFSIHCQGVCLSVIIIFIYAMTNNNHNSSFTTLLFYYGVDEKMESGYSISSYDSLKKRGTLTYKNCILCLNNLFLPT